jgi:hypothetical protein
LDSLFILSHNPSLTSFAILARDQVDIILQRIEGYEKPDLYTRRSGGVWDAYIRVVGVKELFESVRGHVTII